MYTHNAITLGPGGADDDLLHGPAYIQIYIYTHSYIYLYVDRYTYIAVYIYIYIS